jgi:hypothetical protein
MMSATQLKQELQAKVDQLPATKLEEVLDFVSFLVAQQHRASDQQTLNPKNDPLLKFIGAVAHGSLAQDVDEELYRS